MEKRSSRRLAGTLGVLVALGLAGAGVAAAGGGTGSTGSSRLDDGKQLLPQAGISEAQAIAAAQTAAHGALDEVDLESYHGRLAFNVDVGASDVKVDAHTGDVLAADADD